MLIQLVFYVLMLFAIAAMSVDIGLMFLTQTQMQNAADTAALEGLRQRDATGDPMADDQARRVAACKAAAWTFDDNFDDVNPDCMDLGDANPLNLGAGPVLQFTDNGLPNGDWVASQKYDPNGSRAFRPSPLQFNTVNKQQGDMVSGTYGCVLNFQASAAPAQTVPFDNRTKQCPTWTLAYTSTSVTGLSIRIESANTAAMPADADFQAFQGVVVSGMNPSITVPSGTVVVTTGSGPPVSWVRINLMSLTGGGSIVAKAFDYEPPVETATYRRSDFYPAPDASTSQTANSFLVRLRRTETGDAAFDDRFDPMPGEHLDSESGVSSRGPTLPLFFARGTPIYKDPDATTNPSGYNPRLHGLAVRATAISDARPALRLGPIDAAHNLPGAAPFAVTLTSWNVGPLSLVTYTTASPLLTIGDQIVMGVSATPAATGDYYVPIFTSINAANPVDRIVAFGLVRVDATFLPTKVSNAIARANATAVVTSFTPLTPADMREVFTNNALIMGPLLAPVIAR